MKLIYDRAEDMVATTKRHPVADAASDGRRRATAGCVAMDIDFVIDGGAYCTLSPVVLSRGTIHAAGPYFCPNVRLRGRAVATNAPPHGAFRGFGAPQSIFALERQMDRVAAAVGPDARGVPPAQLHPAAGRRAPSARSSREPVDMSGLLDRALELSGYRAKAQRVHAQRTGRPRVRKGIGFATFMHGAGFTGSGEDHLASVVDGGGRADGRVRVLTSPTPRSARARTRSSRRLPPTRSAAAQTPSRSCSLTRRVVPNSGPTVASRTCMVVGKLVETAALGLRRTLVDAGLVGDAYTQRRVPARRAATTSRQSGR